MTRKNNKIIFICAVFINFFYLFFPYGVSYHTFAKSLYQKEKAPRLFSKCGNQSFCASSLIT